MRTSNEKAETSFGAIVLNDSVMRVHLMSPHPSSPDNNKLTPGTMIVLIRERLTHQAGIGVYGSGVSGENRTYTDAEGERVYTGREVSRRVRIKEKPEPEYSAHGIGGKVVLKAIFSASGKVTKLIVVSGLPGGLTEAAVKAASKISFEPALKDGRHVSQWMQLEYDFIP